MMNDDVKPIKIQFDPNQDYQKDAVDAVSGVFDGLTPRDKVEYDLGIDCVPNCETNAVFESYELLENINKVRGNYFPPDVARKS